MNIFEKIRQWIAGPRPSAPIHKSERSNRLETKLAASPKTQKYRWMRIEDRPDRLDHLMVYLIGDTKLPWRAALVCPCGCGAEIDLSLVKDDDPCWSATISQSGDISLYPSVWRNTGCRSHFFLSQGTIRWSPDVRTRTKT